MCDCGEELERRKQASRRRGPGGVGCAPCYADGNVGAGRGAAGGNGRGASGNRGGRGGGKPAGGGKAASGGSRGGGRTGDGASNQTEYWTTIIGGTTLLMGLFTLLYKTFDLGTLWRDKVNGLWGGVLDSMCHNYVIDPCAGLRIKDCKRKWTDGTKLEAKLRDPSSLNEPCQATIIIELEDD